LQQSTAPSIAADIYGVTAFAVFVLAVLRFRVRKSILRATLGIILLFLSLGIWIQLANQGGHILALIVILFALGIVLSKRKKKIYQWKKYDKPRRYFSAVVRDQVIKDQKYKCANCGVGISGALINYDHIDGDRSNNDLSNCQALCPNCHSLKTEDDRRRQ
jgi:hypothetical protein